MLGFTYLTDLGDTGDVGGPTFTPVITGDKVGEVGQKDARPPAKKTIVEDGAGDLPDTPTAFEDMYGFLRENIQSI